MDLQLKTIMHFVSIQKKTNTKNTDLDTNTNSSLTWLSLSFTLCWISGLQEKRNMRMLAKKPSSFTGPSTQRQPGLVWGSFSARLSQMSLECWIIPPFPLLCFRFLIECPFDYFVQKGTDVFENEFR